MFKWLHVLSGSVPSSAWPAGSASTASREDEDPEVQDKERYPFGSREAENSPELGPSDNEEEPRDNDEYVTDEVSLQSVISDML